MKNDPSIESIIRLTSQQDQQSLLGCMVDLLRQELPTVKVSCFEIIASSCDREFNSGNIQGAELLDPINPSIPLKILAEDSGCLEAIATRDVVVEQCNGSTCRRIFPILGARYTTGLLVLERDNSSPAQHIYVRALVRIFGSLALLLRQKERDTLTGLLNREALEVRMARLLNLFNGHKRAHDRTQSLCLAIIDIDKFKAVNDEFGHLFGDEVLLHFSRIITNSFRFDDVLCRYGGEEFIAVLRNVELETALEVLERFRQRVEDYHFPQVGTKTASIGVVEVGHRELLPLVIDKADKALYYAKHHGRNQVRAYEHLVESGELASREVANSELSCSDSPLISG